jgi:hypothetical protein
MQRREKILLFAVLGLLVLWRGAPIVRQTVFGPIEERRSTLLLLDSQVRDAEDKQLAILRSTKQMADWRDRSLPPSEYDAKRLYLQWLADTAQLAGLKELNVTSNPRSMAAKPYVAVQVDLEGKGTLDQVSKFLHCFHRIDLLHRITNLTIRSPSAEGTPQFTFEMTAEGLALREAPDRDHLFPQAELDADLSATATELTVADATGFPEKPGFRIRMENEYATVTRIDGDKWTLARGGDATAAATHRKGSVVELAPVNPEYAERTVKDYAALIAKNPFVKPAPPTAAAPPGEDVAQHTTFSGYFRIDGKPAAWLRNRWDNTTIEVETGSSFQVADVSARVVEITPDALVLERDNSRWSLRLGQNLREMRQLPAAAGPAAESVPQQNAADEDAAAPRSTSG